MRINNFNKFLNESNANKVYQDSLNDDYWKEISNKFPDYNSSDSPDCDKAVEYIYTSMKKSYPNEDWNTISKQIKASIRGGIT